MNTHAALKDRRAAVPLAGVLLAAVLHLSCAETRGPATTEERAKAIALTRSLERDPLAADASAARQWLREWIVDVPEIQFYACDDLVGHGLGAGYPYFREVNEQVLFSGAAFTIEHPNARDRAAIFRAGVEGALRAYDVLLQSRLDARSAFLEGLAAKRDRGELAGHVADLTRAKCKESPLFWVAHLVGAGVGLVLGSLISLRFRGDRSRRAAEAERRARIVRRIVFACAGYYLAAGIALQLLKPEFDPRVRFMSEYVFGPYGWLMSTTFFVLGLGVFALAAGLREIELRAPRARLALGLLPVAAVAVCMAGVFRSGMPHLAAGAVWFPAITMAAVLLSWSFRRAQGWAPIHVAPLAIALAMFAALVAMVAGAAMPGLLQRAFLFLVLAWLSVVAGWLVRVAAIGPARGEGT